MLAKRLYLRYRDYRSCSKLCLLIFFVISIVTIIFAYIVRSQFMANFWIDESLLTPPDLAWLKNIGYIGRMNFEKFPRHFSRHYEDEEKVYEGKNFALINVDLASQIMNFTVKNPSTGQPMSDLEILKADPVFVSAISDNHAREAYAMLNHVRKVYSGSKKVVIYDIGLR